MVPFEITTAMVNLGLWNPEPKMAVRLSIVAILILLFNMLPQRAFRRTETVFTGLKIVTTAGLALCSLYLAIRGLPGTPVRGFRYWHEPGPLNEYLVRGNLGRFLGFLQCLLYSVISFTLTPEITVQRAEQFNNEQGPGILSRARVDSVQFFVLYLLTVFMMTFASPFDESRLTNHGMGAGESPFIVGMNRAQIPVLPVIVTALFFLSSIASGRSFLYISSRALYNLAENGHAPALFATRNRWEVPYAAIIASATFSLFAFMSLAESSSAIFNSLMYFITTSGSISWLCSCIICSRPGASRSRSQHDFFPRVALVNVCSASCQDSDPTTSLESVLSTATSGCLIRHWSHLPPPRLQWAPAREHRRIRLGWRSRFRAAVTPWAWTRSGSRTWKRPRWPTGRHNHGCPCDIGRRWGAPHRT
ncbi:hypothetical protein BO70DRAFT_364491 [Aspergillus heteromorphus CBS 117.55]|uniref:Amino acid permease/ SLC12A domain-containing protein n=1 Tax=Aspergillus heteromorphus CBS 117.55 TaxID=1448321 RepID=A0A317VKY8_9EURO|nr:uncharacterized protein BO70DRAFT_364491 [Aspergillus heteromorphus CBS 117.55]PWY73598.1 hypothetical protein BO70DRAFT_364491 [Aspergillus heteromorphus CBS 117.55]